MGHYQMNTNRGRLNTKSGRKDPRYIEAFEQLRDMEYTVGEARWVADEVLKLMDANHYLTISEAIIEVFK